MLGTIVILDGLIIAMASGCRNGLMDVIGHAGHVRNGRAIPRVVGDTTMLGSGNSVNGLCEVSSPFEYHLFW